MFSKKRTLFFKMLFSSLVRRKSRMLTALLAVAIGAAVLMGNDDGLSGYSGADGA